MSRSFLALALLLAAQPALACRVPRHFTGAEMASQPVVVVGRIVKYRFLPNWPERRVHANGRWASAEDRKMYLDPARSFLFDTAQMTVKVDETLKGRVPERLNVDWAGGNTGVMQAADNRRRIIALAVGPALLPRGVKLRPSARDFHLVDVICGGPMTIDDDTLLARDVGRLLKPRRR